MKKQLIIFILMLFSIDCLFGVDMKLHNEAMENLIKSKPSTEKSYKYLIEINQIHDFNEIYLGFLLKDENAEELLENLFKEAKDNAGKIAALTGLNYLKSPAHDKLKKKLKGFISQRHGGHISHQKVQIYYKHYEKQFYRLTFEEFVNKLPN